MIKLKLFVRRIRFKYSCICRNKIGQKLQNLVGFCLHVIVIIFKQFLYDLVRKKKKNANKIIYLPNFQRFVVFGSPIISFGNIKKSKVFNMKRKRYKIKLFLYSILKMKTLSYQLLSYQKFLAVTLRMNNNNTEGQIFVCFFCCIAIYYLLHVIKPGIFFICVVLRIKNIFNDKKHFREILIRNMDVDKNYFVRSKKKDILIIFGDEDNKNSFIDSNICVKKQKLNYACILEHENIKKKVKYNNYKNWSEIKYFKIKKRKYLYFRIIFQVLLKKILSEDLISNEDWQKNYYINKFGIMHHSISQVKETGFSSIAYIIIRFLTVVENTSHTKMNLSLPILFVFLIQKYMRIIKISESIVFFYIFSKVHVCNIFKIFSFDRIGHRFFKILLSKNCIFHVFRKKFCLTSYFVI